MTWAERRRARLAAFRARRRLRAAAGLRPPRRLSQVYRPRHEKVPDQGEHPAFPVR